MEKAFLNLVKLAQTGNIVTVTIATESSVVHFHVVVTEDLKRSWVHGVDLLLTGSHTRMVWRWLKKNMRDGSKSAAEWDCAGGEAESACRIWTLARFAILDWLKDE